MQEAVDKVKRDAVGTDGHLDLAHIPSTRSPVLTDDAGEEQHWILKFCRDTCKCSSSHLVVARGSRRRRSHGHQPDRRHGQSRNSASKRNCGSRSENEECQARTVEFRSLLRWHDRWLLAETFRRHDGRHVACGRSGPSPRNI